MIHRTYKDWANSERGHPSKRSTPLFNVTCKLPNEENRLALIAEDGVSMNLMSSCYYISFILSTKSPFSPDLFFASSFSFNIVARMHNSNDALPLLPSQRLIVTSFKADEGGSWMGRPACNRVNICIGSIIYLLAGWRRWAR